MAREQPRSPRGRLEIRAAHAPKTKEINSGAAHSFGLCPETADHRASSVFSFTASSFATTLAMLQTVPNQKKEKSQHELKLGLTLKRYNAITPLG